jgi:Na+/proline symporter
MFNDSPDPDLSLFAALITITAISYYLSPRAHTVGEFFRGAGESGEAPDVWTLVLSQVTTWIFARSLLNAGVLGYFYGIAGVLAYAAYYLSFFVGARIVDSLRFRHGADSVQAYLGANFGRLGPRCYNLVVALRLISEVFANLLVVGLLFGQQGSGIYAVTIIATALVTLGYSMLGGLRASLRTDVFQAAILIGLLTVLLAQTMAAEGFSLPAVLTSSPQPDGPGWVLLIVALLQIWSYPLHDPVMMDRGFLADRRVTWLSFHRAGWISLALIVAFGILGVYAGLGKAEGEDLMATLSRLMGPVSAFLINIALFVSAVSTLDSTLASAAKLCVVDIATARPTLVAGRWSMVLFMALGLAMLFTGSDDLYAAVAVSGTASLFLAPVVVFGIWGGWRLRPWTYATAFVAAITGAVIYFLESSGYIGLVGQLAGVEHNYSKLLAICASVLLVGAGAAVCGRVRGRHGEPPAVPADAAETADGAGNANA